MMVLTVDPNSSVAIVTVVVAVTSVQVSLSTDCCSTDSSESEELKPFGPSSRVLLDVSHLLI